MVRIRSATPEDLFALVPLYQAFFTLHRRFLGNEEPLSIAKATDIVQEALQQPQSWLIVAEEMETGQIIGFAC
ncbi:MAG TPA: hypothetical protein G4O02_02765 [Caldilineae bacterium]|nr:hypothetical protein [Caldilineae bacterium]